MEWFIAVVSALIGAVVGALASYLFTDKNNKQRTQRLESAFYNEFEYLSGTLENWFPTLVGEYQEPLREQYSGLPFLDLSLIDALVIELASTDKLVTPTQRKLIVRLRPVIRSLVKNNEKRDEYVDSWMLNSHTMDNSEERNSSKKISYYTGLLLVDVTQAIFHLKKLSTEKERFTFSKSTTSEDLAKACCSSSGIPYDETVWKPMLFRLGHK
ncbi:MULTISPECIES: hypothetical protein [unclassified Vibrio]|uniref:hypothetical protein n=1 Tax=unclassified Vibrio TaxID=2614977 RepID=UPI00159D5BB8|nr:MULTISPECIES: hypothetical protein [unclassified Vibrio]NVN80579.1 hypothetical protein [Vibrio sp. Scap16]QLE95607.1 hypothetical protein FLM53_21795 [Vibrio sp. Scap24]